MYKYVLPSQFQFRYVKKVKSLHSSANRWNENVCLSKLIPDPFASPDHVMPNTTHCGELESLWSHMELASKDEMKGRDPTLEEMKWLLPSMLHYYGKCQWRNENDFLSRERFHQVMISHLKKDSSPGFPHCYKYPTNKELFTIKGTDPPELDYSDTFVGNHVHRCLKVYHCSYNYVHVYKKM